MHMMHVRRMRVRVTQSAVLMEMRVRLAWRVDCAVHVLMMFVMDVRVGMRERRGGVLMFVTFGQVQPDAGGHQRARDGKLRGYRLAERDDSWGRDWRPLILSSWKLCGLSGIRSHNRECALEARRVRPGRR
jgi:hypothetical protein